MVLKITRAALRSRRRSSTARAAAFATTLPQRTLYYACALDDGTVLRVSAGLVGRVAMRIVRPLNCLDLDHPLENDAYEELVPLLRRVHQEWGQISAQLRELRAKADEFEQITSHSCVRQGFLTVNRTPEMSQAVRTALDEGHGFMHSRRNDREYQFDLSRIDSEGAAAVPKKRASGSPSPGSRSKSAACAPFCMK